MAGTDFSHLTSDELIKGIKALDLPDYIRSKAYGIDVRETLAQMTEMTIQLGVNMGLSPDDALLWARKLQESVSQSEFDSWVATLLDGGPSIFMNTLSELKATYPNGAAGVALVRETDPAKIYVWNGNAWESFGDYQGIEVKDNSVTSAKIVDGAVTGTKLSYGSVSRENINVKAITSEKIANRVVTALKTDFIEEKNNLLSTATYFDGILQGTESTAYLNVLNNGSITYVLPIKPGTTYQVARTSDSNRFRLAVFANMPSNGTVVQRWLLQGDSTNSASFTARENENYLAITVSNAGNAPRKMIVREGTTRINLNEESLTLEQLLHTLPNGYVYSYVKDFEIDYGARAINVTSSCYVLTNKNRYQALTQTIAMDTSSFGNYVSFDTDKGTFYADGYSSFKSRLSSNTNLVFVGYLNRGDEKESINGMYSVVGRDGGGNGSSDDTESISKFQTVAGVTSGVYDYEAVDFNPWSAERRSLDNLYGIYDGLVADYPENWTKTFLGNDEGGMPLNRYDYTPASIVNGREYPKLILTATHGHETQAIYGLAYAINEFRKWDTNQIIASIFDNFKMIIVPVSNPYGFTKGQRPTFNGVDVNRNYTAGWYQNDNPPQGYGTHGTAPMSEFANQKFDEILQANRDALFVIDNHNYAGDPFTTNPEAVTWIQCTNENASLVADTHIKAITNKARKDGYIPKNKIVGSVKPIRKASERQGWSIDQVQYYGFDGVLMESMNTLNSSTTDLNIHKYNVESFINLLVTVARVYGN